MSNNLTIARQYVGSAISKLRRIDSIAKRNNIQRNEIWNKLVKN